MCAQVLSQWMPMDEEPTGRGAWGRRRTPQVAASVLLLIDSHPLVLNFMVSPCGCSYDSAFALCDIDASAWLSCEEVLLPISWSCTSEGN